jgi:hypothetical protein
MAARQSLSKVAEQWCQALTPSRMKRGDVHLGSVVTSMRARMPIFPLLAVTSNTKGLDCQVINTKFKFEF